MLDSKHLLVIPAACLTLWFLLARSWLAGLAAVGYLSLSALLGPSFLPALGLPAGIYLYCVVSLASRRQWGRVAILLFLTVASTLAVCLPWLYFDSREVGAFRYVWGGWYTAFLVGAYAVGFVVLLFIGINRMMARSTAKG